MFFPPAFLRSTNPCSRRLTQPRRVLKGLLLVLLLVSMVACGGGRDGQLQQLNARLETLNSQLSEVQNQIAQVENQLTNLKSQQVGLRCNQEEAPLTQAGDLSSLIGVGDTDIFYPRPYALPPALKLPVELGHIGAALIEQRTDGFRVRLSRYNPGIRSRQWQATGMAASSCQ